MMLEATVIPLTTLPTAHPSAESVPSTTAEDRSRIAEAILPAPTS